ncbi:LysM peptidoglycan-binding domain-containing protein [Staphylospora marina]|uniref:LysM peptidoglycan-binding domain-containing protein n=1 Tax=Staphylospora marina TaxID=2490858 RepID=UPI000F5C0511|nr:LysM peptidoglycan-binding domain-containing protein [Staphylospora marina]
MENPFAQLRFDISEKVRLHPQQPGIDTLLEMDLYPDVEIKDEGQHLKIQGYLRLSGTYLASKDSVETGAGDGERTEIPEEELRHELAYVIPVEITLPADRAEQNRILAEVESFDYSVLSPFELKIEAVLMIDGLIPDQKDVEAAREEEEELPEVPAFSGAPARPLTIQGSEDRQEEAEDPDRAEEPESRSGKEQPVFEGWDRGESPAESGALFPDTTGFRAGRPEEESPRGLSEEWESPVQHRGQPPEEFWKERQESRKFRDGDNDGHEPSQIRPEEADERHGLHEEAEGAVRKQTDWIRWLIGNKPEQFTPMRMVIVRKEESVNQLADRYEVSANQLIRVNRLTTDLLEEGQILHIPDRKNAP